MILFCFIVYMWKKLFKKEAFYHLKKKKEPLVHTKDPSGRKMSKIKSKLFLSLKLEGMWVKKKKKKDDWLFVCVSSGLAPQCHMCHFHQDSGGVYDLGQSQFDSWPPTSWKGNFTFSS